MAGTKGRRDGAVTASELTTFADPLDRGSALTRGEAELIQVQSLPWRDRGGAAPDHPTLQEPGARGAEPAVSVEYQDRP
jgi:hypothetical protein